MISLCFKLKAAKRQIIRSEIGSEWNSTFIEAIVYRLRTKNTMPYLVTQSTKNADSTYNTLTGSQSFFDSEVQFTRIFIRLHFMTIIIKNAKQQVKVPVKEISIL